MTLRAFLTAQALPVETLKQIGFLTAVIPAATWKQAVAELVAQIRDLAPLAAQLTKRTIREIASGTDEADVIKQRQDLTASSLDFQEGRKAFAEKRRPNFTGK